MLEELYPGESDPLFIIFTSLEENTTPKNRKFHTLAQSCSSIQKSGF